MTANDSILAASADEIAWQAQNWARIEQRIAELRAQDDDTLFTEWWEGHFVVLTKSDEQVRLWLLDESAANTSWVQSILDLEDPLYLALGYTQAMLLSLAWQPEPQRIFVSGLGGGSLPMLLHHHLPQVRIDCVEISPVIVEAATTYLPLPRDERLTIHVADAADVLAAASPATYDILLLDLFGDDGKTPEHVTAHAFFECCAQCLGETGVFAMNLYRDAPEHTQRLQRIQDVFAHTQVCSMPSAVDVVLAAQQPLSRFELLERSIAVQRRRQFHFRLPDWVHYITTARTST